MNIAERNRQALLRSEQAGKSFVNQYVPAVGSSVSTYGPAQKDLMEKTSFLQRLFPSAEYKAERGAAKELDIYNAQVGRQAEQDLASVANTAQTDQAIVQQALDQSGVDPMAKFGMGYQMGTAQNPEQVAGIAQLAEATIANPQYSEAARQAEQQGLMAQQQAQVKAQGEAQALENQLLRENAAVMKPLMAGRRSLNAARDLRTLTSEGGSVLFPGKSRGAYKALRFQGINAIRETTEAGALQAAEIEFFESIVPSYDDWIKLSNAERIAQNKELEYFFETKLRDDLQASGQGIDFAEFMGEGRTIDQILTPGQPEGTNLVDRFTDPIAGALEIVSQPGALGGAQGTLPQIDLSKIGTGFGAR